MGLGQKNIGVRRGTHMTSTLRRNDRLRCSAWHIHASLNPKFALFCLFCCLDIAGVQISARLAPFWRSGRTYSGIRSVIFCVTKFGYKNCLLECHLPIIMLVL